ncbi:carboxypeptidase regulatory-like domain-containing protein [bacterium]|nr:carboxypeptidase regulatory-like domain-containing protein [bacterium]
MTRFIFTIALLGGIVFSLSGCGGPSINYDSVQLLPVSGTVTLDGEPLAGATVQFQDEKTFTFSFGYTDEAGNYKLQFDSQMAGCIPGEKSVRITTTGPIGEGEGYEAGESEVPGGGKKERLPARYNKKSELRAHVTPEQVVFDFDLKSK